eukprot:COSAG06_NODE_3180_length_5723_cov_3.051209_4_plen_246_part_01
METSGADEVGAQLSKSQALAIKLMAMETQLKRQEQEQEQEQERQQEHAAAPGSPQPERELTPTGGSSFGYGSQPEASGFQVVTANVPAPAPTSAAVPTQAGQPNSLLMGSHQYRAPQAPQAPMVGFPHGGIAAPTMYGHAPAPNLAGAAEAQLAATVAAQAASTSTRVVLPSASEQILDVEYHSEGHLGLVFPHGVVPLTVASIQQGLANGTPGLVPGMLLMGIQGMSTSGLTYAPPAAPAAAPPA